ncbi:insulinase family protein [Hoylesella nanceiensis]|uniref:M16 family metallopeptidase n=1 Tax=Hoylesella nanceiensis TaxID=425941 RepID=UPI0028ED9BE0|nr:insulinase family protein [Hoylesella nanceiensis]
MMLKKLFVAVLLLISTVAQAQQLPDMPVDPKVRIGKLSNGLTYYIRHNNWPEKRASFYIAQKVGSLQEEESQRGLAHFLEHMCFNGTDNFKGNDLIRYCESLGVQFGADLNAYTSIDETVYNISNVPTTRQTALDSCLLILRDWATGLTLDPKEIDQERGVIHEEWRLRTSPESRMFERNLPALYPGSKYGLRYPIGLMSVVDNFKYKELRDYYEKWYHPDNQGIIVVGDIDVDHTEAMIKKLFGGIKNPANLSPIVKENVPDNKEPIVVVDKDKECQSNSVMIFFKHDPFPEAEKNNLVYTITETIKSAAMSMLNSRLSEATLKPECPYIQASVEDGMYIFSKTKDALSINIVPKDPSRTNEAITTVVKEVRKAAEFGFTESEFARYMAKMQSVLDNMYSERDKRSNDAFCKEYYKNFLENEPIPSMEDYYGIMKQVLPGLSVAPVNELMGQLLPKDNENLVAVSFNNEKEGAVYPTKEGILGAINAAREAKIEAYVDNTKNEPLIAKLPKAGKIVKEQKNKQFDYTVLTLSNGAKVILKKTDYKKDKVSMTAEGLGGSSLYGPQDYINLNNFDGVIGISGLGKFTSLDLTKALAGKIANADLGISGKYTNMSGSATPKDLETMFQLAYLYFTDITKDQKAFDSMIKGLEVNLKNRELSADVAFGDSISATVYGHNPRLKPLLLSDLNKINYDRILQIAKERTANAAGWTFTFIGNFDETAIRQYICQYIASLPAKGKIQKGHKTAFMVKGEVTNKFTRKMETPKATAYMVWHNESLPYTNENAIKADIAGQILEMVYLNKIREEASAAYSVQAAGRSEYSEDYHNFSFVAYCPMKPEKQQEAIDIMTKELPALATTVDASMLDKVKKTMLKNYDNALKTNGYWSKVIYMNQRYGFDVHSDYRKLVEAQTPETIKAFVKEFLKSKNRISVIMLPEAQ